MNSLLSSTRHVACTHTKGQCTRHATRVSAAASETYTPPSSLAGQSELQWLKSHSTVLVEHPMDLGQSRLVSFGVLRAIATSERLGIKPLQNALTTARTVSSDPERQVDQALANVGLLLAAHIDGRITTEVNPRLANDKGALVAKARTLAELYKQLHLPPSRVLFRIPATWAGVQAAGELEKQGLNVLLSMVYSVVQGVAGAQHGATLINPRVGRTRDWYQQNPGVIRDPKGPRQDAGLGDGSDPAILLVTDLYNYVKVHHPKTQVMASSLRTRDDALALSGCDFLLLPHKVAEEMQAVPTTSGYNDGLRMHATQDEDMALALTPAKAKEAAPKAMTQVTEQAFHDGLGLAGTALLTAHLANAIKDVDALGDLARATTGITST